MINHTEVINMAISYLLAPNPKWYIADLTGKPLGGGSMATYRSLDKTEPKFVYQDPGGNFPWPNPLPFDENGSQGPIYWAIDSLDLNETYYVEVYDADGNLQWTIDQFVPPGSGGGGNVTTAISLLNFVTNPVFWRNTGNSSIPAPLSLRLAPGAHAGLAYTASLAYPDIYFFKSNNSSSSDQIRFVDFILGLNPLIGDVTPAQYFNYDNPIAGAAETYKYLQFPITSKVNSLSNQDISFSYWARGTGVTQVKLVLRQFFGDGIGASADEFTILDSETLTGGWQRYTGTATIPSVSGKILGACGNDGLFLQFQLPLDFACSIDFTKPAIYLGNIFAQEEYLAYDMIDAVINAPRTGHVISAYDLGNNALPGYIYMNDGSIGSITSGATTRANQDTFPLYSLLWNNVADAWAPVSGGRGATAVADFLANKPLTLMRQLGRVLAGSGQGAGLSNWALGQFFGEEGHQLTIPELPSHNHPSVTGTGRYVAPQGAVTNIGLTVNAGETINNNAENAMVGGNQPHNTMQPTTFTNFFIKL